jgi:hypothetical protein
MVPAGSNPWTQPNIRLTWHKPARNIFPLARNMME